jgi:hypothetical protein
MQPNQEILSAEQIHVVYVTETEYVEIAYQLVIQIYLQSNLSTHLGSSGDYPHQAHDHSLHHRENIEKRDQTIN